jgi:hypothetical protein
MQKTQNNSENRRKYLDWFKAINLIIIKYFIVLLRNKQSSIFFNLLNMSQINFE